MTFSWTTHAQERTNERFKTSSRCVDVSAYQEMNPDTIPYEIGQTFKIHTKIHTKRGKQEVKLICTRAGRSRIKVITVLYPYEKYQKILKVGA